MKILIAEDDDVSRLALETLLTGWGYEVVTAEEGTQAAKLLLKEDAPRLAILDWMMPGLDGAEVCRVVRRPDRTDYAYLILLTAKSQKQDMLNGLDAGADDYLSKPFDPQELRARLRAGQRVLELQQALREQATHDALTGTQNRGAILEGLDRELARARRERSTVGIVIADLDHFKRVNDTHGHQVGDAVLREVAQRMGSVLRGHDLLGRYGGEEFLILLPGCGLKESWEVAERVRRGVAERPITTPAGSINLTLSLGTAATISGDFRESDALIQVADEALYRAKRGGRNRTEMADIPQEAASR